MTVRAVRAVRFVRVERTEPLDARRPCRDKGELIRPMSEEEEEVVMVEDNVCGPFIAGDAAVEVLLFDREELGFVQLVVPLRPRPCVFFNFCLVCFFTLFSKSLLSLESRGKMSPGENECEVVIGCFCCVPGQPFALNFCAFERHPCV